MPTVANNCNNYVTICNKNELIEHYIVIETCCRVVTNLGGYYVFWVKESDREPFACYLCIIHNTVRSICG